MISLTLLPEYTPCCWYWQSEYKYETSSDYSAMSTWPLALSAVCGGDVGGRLHVNNVFMPDALTVWLWSLNSLLCSVVLCCVVLCVQRHPREEMRDYYCESRGAEQLQGQYECTPPEKLLFSCVYTVSQAFLHIFYSVFFPVSGFLSHFVSSLSRFSFLCRSRKDICIGGFKA